MEKNNAFVTVLSTDSYLPGVLALFESLKRTNSKINTFAVVINENIQEDTKKRLQKEGYRVILKESIAIPESIQVKNSMLSTSNWNNSFDKFNLFGLDEFDKIVYLDSDMYVNKNIDELFDKPNMSAVVAGKSCPGNEFWKELNSGIMVIEPKKEVVQELVNKMLEMSKPRIKVSPKRTSNKMWKTTRKPTVQGVFKNLFKYVQGKGDQDVIESYYNWKDNPHLELDEKYNVFSYYTDYYINKLGYSKDDLSVIHFIGAKKPWMLSDTEITAYQERCKRKNNVAQLDFFNKYLEIIKDKEVQYLNSNIDKNIPTFSIIIPMKNADRYIKNTLDSIFNQNFNDIQVLVVDDNSDYTDISKYIVTSYKNHHPNINLQLLKTVNDEGGPGGARNVGIDNAIGKYILFLDADDALTDNSLYSIKKTISENPDTDMFVLGYQLIRRDEYERDIKTYNLPAGKLQESRFFQIGANTAGSIWNLCINRCFFGDKDDENKIRFKPNCKFEDLPIKVNLFVRNKKKIKTVPIITHSQYSRDMKSITGTLTLKDMIRMLNAHYEIANIKDTESNLGLKDKIYIDARKFSMIATCSWLFQKAIRNKLTILSKKREERKKILEDEITLEM